MLTMLCLFQEKGGSESEIVKSGVKHLSSVVAVDGFLGSNPCLGADCSHICLGNKL